MSYKNKGDSDLLLNSLQLILHLLTELQIQCRKRLIQKQNLRLIYKRSCNGHTLLLSTGKQGCILILITFQTDQLQHLHNLLVNDVFTHLLNFQSKSNIFIYTQMRK